MKQGSPETSKYLHNLLKEVQYARCCKTYDSKTKRLEVNVKPNSDSEKVLQQILVPLWLRDKAVKLEGVAPPGDLERRIQQAIDEFEAQ
eukprot:1193123-Pyramimonas_sp.AAC.1